MLRGKQVSFPQQVRWLKEVSFPQQIRWCTSEAETSAGRVPGEGSISTDSRSARTPAHKGRESTSDLGLVRGLHLRAQFQMIRDADTGPARLSGKMRVEEAWSQTVHTPTRHTARQSEAWWR